MRGLGTRRNSRQPDERDPRPRPSVSGVRTSSKGPLPGTSARRDRVELRAASRRGAADARARSFEVLAAIERSASRGTEIDLLIGRVREGDGVALVELYLLFFPRTYRWLMVALKNHHDAEELAHDVFVRVLNDPSAYERRGQPFGAWMFRVTRNLAIDHLRRRERIDLEEPDAIARLHDGGWNSRTERDCTREAAGETKALLSGLPEHQQRVLALKYYSDMSASGIADLLGTSADAVRHTQQRALRSLARTQSGHAGSVSACGFAPSGSRPAATSS